MARAERKKKNHKFQLNVSKEGELWLHEWIEYLTKERKFSQYVRDGLRLMIDLSAGNLDVLIELFPWVSDRLAAAQPAPTPQPPAPDTSELAKEIATQLILRGGKDTLQMMQGGLQPDSNRTPTTGKQLAAPAFAMPTFDDDDTPTVIISKSNDLSSANNFVTSLQMMQ